MTIQMDYRFAATMYGLWQMPRLGDSPGADPSSDNVAPAGRGLVKRVEKRKSKGRGASGGLVRGRWLIREPVFLKFCFPPPIQWVVALGSRGTPGASWKDFSSNFRC